MEIILTQTILNRLHITTFGGGFMISSPIDEVNKGDVYKIFSLT